MIIFSPLLCELINKFSATELINCNVLNRFGCLEEGERNDFMLELFLASSNFYCIFNTEKQMNS